MTDTPATPDPQPTREVALSDATLAALVECERTGRHYSDGEGKMVIEISTTRLMAIVRNALDRFAAQHSTAAQVSDESVIEAGIEAASEYVSSLPMGQKAWGKKEYGIAEVAARTVAQHLTATPVSGDARERGRNIILRHVRLAKNSYVRNPKTNDMTLDLQSVDEAAREIAAAITAAEDKARQETIERKETLEDALHKILQWSEAYPLDIFTEPDWAKTRTLLAAGGITLDSVSGACCRRCVDGIGQIARLALVPAPEKGT